MDTEILEMTAETVGGDLLGALVQELKLLPKPWPAMGEDEQDELIDRLRKRVATNVREAVRLIATEGRVTVRCDLESVVFKNGTKAVVKIGGRDPARLELADSIGKACLLVVADPGRHLGGMDEVKGEPNQAELEGFANNVIENARRDSLQQQPPIDDDGNDDGTDGEGGNNEDHED